MTEEINKQIELLEKYGVNDYVIENGRIVINGSLWLNSLTTAPDNFLSKTIVDGWVIRKNVHKYGFLSSDKNKDKIAQFVKGDALEGEGVEIRQDKTL